MTPSTNRDAAQPQTRPSIGRKSRGYSMPLSLTDPRGKVAKLAYLYHPMATADDDSED